MSGAGDSARRLRVRRRSKAGRGPRHWPMGTRPDQSAVHPPVLRRRVAELRKADPSDSTGYLAFLDGRRALDEFQAGMDLHHAAIDPAAVDSLIARAKLRGESLQEALVLRAAGEILAGEDRRALHTLAAAVNAQATRTRFDRGDFVLLDAGLDRDGPAADRRRRGRPGRRESPSITPCTGSSSSICRILTNGRAARHSSPASGSARRSATGTAAP